MEAIDHSIAFKINTRDRNPSRPIIFSQSAKEPLATDVLLILNKESNSQSFLEPSKHRNVCSLITTHNAMG